MCLFQELTTGWNRDSYRGSGTPDFKRRSAISITVFRPKEISALEIAAEQVSADTGWHSGLKLERKF